MDNDYTGIIIEESLEDTSILDNLKILKTEIVMVTEKAKTPWLKKWTLHTISIKEKDVDGLAKTLSELINKKHSNSWYVDFRNKKYHYVIFLDKIFKIKVGDKKQEQEVIKYGLSLGIPAGQLNIF